MLYTKGRLIISLADYRIRYVAFFWWLESVGVFFIQYASLALMQQSVQVQVSWVNVLSYIPSLCLSECVWMYTGVAYFHPLFASCSTSAVAEWGWPLLNITCTFNPDGGASPTSVFISQLSLSYQLVSNSHCPKWWSNSELISSRQMLMSLSLSTRIT